MGRRISAARRSPAAIVAVLALVAALAGTAVAGPDASTSAVNGKKVKRIAKRQAVKQINKLAPGLSVASAKTAGAADSAKTASNATTAGSVDGLSAARIDYRIPSGPSAERTILDIGGLILRAQCDGSGNIDVEADTRVAGAVITVAVSKAANISRTFHDDDFNPGDDNEILEEAFTFNFDIQGTLTYSTAAGSHVTATFQSDEVPFGPNSCLFAGTALHAPA